ncbi:hypothetical protein BKA70DRAFT_495895 [Coprinopsis sp. MPI-PUGE-AT-0042]|nr:hypothetical protein BKA70DRAFT_495895 [Coprinopsis sp. MPI-PUGE-AT-0042]
MLKEYQDGFSRVEAAERLARALKGPLRKAPNGIDEQGIIVADNNAGLMPDGLYALKVIKFGTKEFGRMKHTVDYVVEVLEAGAVSTCRNLFYTDVKLFREKQTVADNCVYTLAATIFTVSRGELGLSLLEMGMEIDNDVTISARGAVLFDNLGGRIVCNTTSGMIIPANTVWIRVPPGVAAAVQIEKHCAHTSVRSGLHEPGWLSEGRAQESQDDLQQPPKEELVVLSSRGWPTIGGRILARSIARQMSVCEAPLLHVTDLDYGGIWGLLLNINGATKTSHLYGGYPREDGTVWVVRAGLTARELYNE